MAQRTPPAKGRTEQGSIILYLALALVAFGLLATIGATRFGASVTSVLSPNCATAARYMAEAGLRYATARMRNCATATDLAAAVGDMNGHGFYTVDAQKGLGFTLSVSYTAAYTATVTSTGKGCSVIAPVTATAKASNINLPVVAANALDPTTVSVSFGNDFAEFNIATAGTSGAITKNPGDKTMSLGNNITTGVESGVWFKGTNALCADGACAIGNGVCATYTLQFNQYTATQGDGLAWVIMNASSNTADSFAGGGEFLGYGGLSSKNTTIAPPKLEMEYDITPNYKHCGKVCQATEQIACDDGTDNSPNDHIALMYWGSQTLSCNAAMDDHIHGAGAGSTSAPYNSYNFDGSRDGYDGYFTGTTESWLPTGVWLRSASGPKTFYVRYELDRATTANAQGNYIYTQRAWVSTSSSIIATCGQAMTTQPTVERAVALSPTMHAALGTSYFGWTVGSGAYSELAKLSAFNLNFKGAPSVTPPTVPPDYTAAFTFGEGAGLTTYSSNGALAGALSGAVMWTPDVRTTNSTSLFFTNAGTDGIVTVPDAAALRPSTAGTIACWVSLREAGTTAPLVYKRGSYTLQVNSNRTLSLILTNGGTTTVTTYSWNTLGSNAKWYHVAATWNGATVRLYINGSQARSTNTSRTAATTSNALLIGGNGSTSFDGRIDDLYLYDRALSAAEITGLASGSHY
ncbi:MAG: hypothetical protein AUJ49_10155 [Desulfovibrionaceae bacterium CG1_02_65_16]|nr:MAG: hypothetical protein AUJ49_10155 [Desulfovibrionaceae bacterium CG1_02_65_16]